MANAVTVFRMAAGAALLFCPAFSPPFFVLYLAAGFSDMIDGSLARRTGTAGESGAKLDTLADSVFAAACLGKLLPVLSVPPWLWVWIGLIALIKTANLISGYAMRKKYVALHTLMNKVTGALLFVLPLTLPFVELRYSAPPVCAAATFAAIQEGHFIRTGREDS